MATMSSETPMHSGSGSVSRWSSTRAASRFWTRSGAHSKKWVDAQPTRYYLTSAHLLCLQRRLRIHLHRVNLPRTRRLNGQN
eukprot:3995981-Prymnesium_polylepis.1